jgi:hypothetical protein
MGAALLVPKEIGDFACANVLDFCKLFWDYN